VGSGVYVKIVSGRARRVTRCIFRHLSGLKLRQNFRGCKGKEILLLGNRGRRSRGGSLPELLGNGVVM
jgi:hypothetical protein